MGDVLPRHERRGRLDLSSFYDEHGVSRYYDGSVIDANGLRNTPKFILGTIKDVRLGDEYDRCDYKREPMSTRPMDKRRGLQNFVRFEHNGVPVYVVDEHHHALWAWAEAIKMKILQPNARLIHIDAHDDYGWGLSRQKPPKNWRNLADVRDFVIRDLNEGNFIQMALQHKIVADGTWIQPEGRWAMYDEKRPGLINHGIEWAGIKEMTKTGNKGKRILDIDVDYFWDHLFRPGDKPRHRKTTKTFGELFESDMNKIKALIPHADVVTLCIPPAREHLDPIKGIEIARQLFA